MKLMLLINGRNLPSFILLFLLVCSKSVVAQPKLVSTSKQETRSKIDLNLSLQTGFASFQKINIPTESQPNTGTTTDNIGVPLGFQIGSRFSFADWNYDLEGTVLQSPSINPQTSADQGTISMHRIGVNQFLSWNISRSFHSGFGVLLNRQTIKDGSYAHSIDTVALALREEIFFSSKISSGFTASYSPVSRFGFNDQASIRSKAIAGSKSSSAGMKLALNYRLGERGELDTSWQYDRHDILYNPESTYSSYGLNLSSAMPQQSRVILQSNVILIGFGRRF